MNKRFFAGLFTLSLSLINIAYAAPNQPTRTEMEKKLIQQLNAKLVGVEQAYTVAMTEMLIQELNNYGTQQLMSAEFMEQLKNSIIATYAYNLAAVEAAKRTENANKINEFANMWLHEVNKKLANNERLDAFFNKGLYNTADMHFPQQKQNVQQPVYQPVQPQPSAPVMNTSPQVVLAQWVYCAQTDIDRYRLSQGNDELNKFRAHLQANLKDRDATRLEAFFLKSILQYSGIAPCEAQHKTNALIALFDYELDHIQRRLAQEIESSRLEQGIKSTREKGHSQIRVLTISQMAKFSDILKTLEETVVQNAEVACSVCCESYKGRDKFGIVDEIQLKNSSGSKHKHSICKNCAKQGRINSCPECRANIDQRDLLQQINQPQHPANWRP